MSSYSRSPSKSQNSNSKRASILSPLCLPISPRGLIVLLLYLKVLIYQAQFVQRDTAPFLIKGSVALHAENLIFIWCKIRKKIVKITYEKNCYYYFNVYLFSMLPRLCLSWSGYRQLFYSNNYSDIVGFDLCN